MASGVSATVCVGHKYRMKRCVNKLITVNVTLIESDTGTPPPPLGLADGLCVRVREFPSRRHDDKQASSNALANGRGIQFAAVY